METTFNFTKEKLERVPLPSAGKRAAYSDTKMPGLQLRVTSSGAKTFSLYRRVKGGEPIRVTLGRFPLMTVEAARKRAGELNADIENRANPAELRREEKQVLTFAELFAGYMQGHSKPKKRTWKEDEDKFRLYLEKPLAKRRLSDIGRREVATIHASITADGHGTTANRVVALISSIYGWADESGLWHENPAQGIRRNREKTREQFIQSDELPRFFRAVGVEANLVIRDYFLLSLLTGARRSNVLAMRYSEISFERAEWRIPRTKNENPQTVTLSAEAVAILRERYDARGAEPFVFPGTGETGHLVEPKKGWLRVRERMAGLLLIEHMAEREGWSADETDAREVALLKAENSGKALRTLHAEALRVGLPNDGDVLPDLRIHDLRRTLGSWQAKSGSSLAIIGKSLNHRSTQTTAIYARLDLDPVRESVERATSAMFATARESAEILRLKKPA